MRLNEFCNAGSVAVFRVVVVCGVSRLVTVGDWRLDVGRPGNRRQICKQSRVRCSQGSSDIFYNKL